MPTVPYTGAPEVSPQSAATPRNTVDAPIGAFGAGSAAGLSTLGQDLSGAGNELFTRALAMQDLYNHTQALDADTKFMEAAGDIHAKFSAMQGKDAVDYFQNNYQQDMESARSSIRDSLPNDMARKIYDESSKSTLGRNVFNAAGYAATQNKNYAIGASAARVTASRDAALANPTDEVGFQTHVNETIANTRAQWELKGADPDTIDNATHKAVSDLYYDRITGLARTQPFAANALLTQATKDGKIAGEDLGKITDVVRSAMHTVGARNISAEVSSGSDLSFGSKPVGIAQAKTAIGTFESGNNYQSIGVETGHGQALGKYQVMPENLGPWLKEAGLPPMSPKEFLASPSAQDKVFETVFGRYMNETGSFNDAASKWFSGKTVTEARNAKDANGTTVPQYLLATNRVLAQNAGLADKVAAARTKADAMAPNDPLFPDFAEQRVIADHNQTLAVKRDDEYNTRQTVESALVAGDQQGKLPTSVDDLKAISPQAEAAWNNLQPSDQRKYTAYLAKAAKGDVSWNNDRLGEYQRLKGMAQSDPAGFLDQDVLNSDLPLSARKELINLQVSKKANAESDPRVTHALQILRPMTDSASLSRKDDADGYDKFVGNLQDALEQYSQDNKKPADAKAVQEIGARLMQTQASTGWFGSNVGADKLFKVSVPDEEHAKIVGDPYWTKAGITPSEDMVQRIYVRQLYNQLYGAKPKTTIEATAK